MRAYLTSEVSNAFIPAKLVGRNGDNLILDFGSYTVEADAGSVEFVADADAEEIEGDDSPAALIREAGKLNNNPKLVNTDHVSIMGLMDQSEMVLHVAKLRQIAA